MRSQINVRLPPRLVEDARAHAGSTGRSLTDVVEDGLTKLLYGEEESRLDELDRRVSRLEDMVTA